MLATASIALEGPLGAGKTTFVRHLLHALGVSGRVRSPTFAVLEPYALPRADGATLAVSHFDFYRFEDPHEWESAGFRDVFAAPGLKLVEWPERAAGLMPLPDLTLHLEPTAIDPQARDVTATAHSAIGLELLRAWATDATPPGAARRDEEPA